ncbi:MAG: hypothetical protein ACRELY_23970 [Polyangiaceae bacterium]
MMKRLILPLIALSALAGCGSSYQRDEITNTSQADFVPEPGVTLQRIAIPLGSITTANVIPYNSDNNPMIGNVTSDNPNILLVEGAHGNKWAFSGVNIGTTTVKFFADGQTVATVQAVVCDQGDSACAGSP